MPFNYTAGVIIKTVVVVMDGSLKLIILSAVMLFGSYLAGSIPLFISLSEEKLQVSSTVVNGSKTNYSVDNEVAYN